MRKYNALILKKGVIRIMKHYKNILVGMDPVIREYHQGTWFLRERPPQCAEDLDHEWRRRIGL
jgi:hypothetical protein